MSLIRQAALDLLYLSNQELRLPFLRVGPASTSYGVDSWLSYTKPSKKVASSPLHDAFRPAVIRSSTPCYTTTRSATSVVKSIFVIPPRPSPPQHTNPTKANPPSFPSTRDQDRGLICIRCRRPIHMHS